MLILFHILVLSRSWWIGFKDHFNYFIVANFIAVTAKCAISVYALWVMVILLELPFFLTIFTIFDCIAKQDTWFSVWIGMQKHVQCGHRVTNKLNK